MVKLLKSLTGIPYIRDNPPPRSLKLSTREPNARCEIPPLYFLLRIFPRYSKTAQTVGIALGHYNLLLTLLLKTAHTLVTRHEKLVGLFKDLPSLWVAFIILKCAM